MRFRLGLITGGAVGYYFGAKAGRERYEQLNQWLQQLSGSEAVETAEEKTKAVLDLGKERARDFVEERGGSDDAGMPDATVVRGDAGDPMKTV